MAGSSSDLSFASEVKKDNSAYLTDASLDNDDGIDKTVSYDWDSLTVQLIVPLD